MLIPLPTLSSICSIINKKKVLIHSFIHSLTLYDKTILDLENFALSLAILNIRLSNVQGTNNPLGIAGFS